jgi:hypothetical protein
MLFIIIPTAWLGVIAFVVILCRMAALGDTAQKSPRNNSAMGAIGERIVLGTSSIGLSSQIRRPSGHRAPFRSAMRPVAQRRAAAHGLR